MQTPEILYEDDQILVCHKPAGVPVQTKKIGTQDMESILKNYLHTCGCEKSEPAVTERSI